MQGSRTARDPLEDPHTEQAGELWDTGLGATYEGSKGGSIGKEWGSWNISETTDMSKGSWKCRGRVCDWIRETAGDEKSSIYGIYSSSSISQSSETYEVSDQMGADFSETVGHTCPKAGLRRVCAGSVTVPRMRNLLRSSGFGGGVLRIAGDNAYDWTRGARAGVDICIGLEICPSDILGA